MKEKNKKLSAQELLPASSPDKSVKAPPDEIGGFADQNLLEPTRYGDWDVKGRCSDF